VNKTLKKTLNVSACTANLPTGLYILLTLISYFVKFELNYLRIYWTDFHDILPMKGICVNSIDPELFFQFLKGHCHGKLATSFGQNDLHLPRWCFEMHLNIAISI